MNPELKTEWVDALRSGKYKQAQGMLYNQGRDAHCCLGVLCEVGIIKGQVRRYNAAYDLVDNAGNSTHTELNRAFLDWSGISDLEQNDLVERNDARDWSFDQIANFIEEEM